MGAKQRKVVTDLIVKVRLLEVEVERLRVALANLEQYGKTSPWSIEPQTEMTETTTFGCNLTPDLPDPEWNTHHELTGEIGIVDGDTIRFQNQTYRKIEPK